MMAHYTENVSEQMKTANTTSLNNRRQETGFDDPLSKFAALISALFATNRPSSNCR